MDTSLQVNKVIFMHPIQINETTHIELLRFWIIDAAQLEIFFAFAFFVSAWGFENA